MHVLEMRVFHVMPDLWCKTCGQFRPFDDFHNTPKDKGKRYVCKHCIKAKKEERERKVDV